MALNLEPVSSSAVLEWGYDPSAQTFGVVYVSDPDIVYLYENIDKATADVVFEKGQVSIGAQAIPFLKDLDSSPLTADADEYRVQRREMHMALVAGLQQIAANAYL